MGGGLKIGLVPPLFRASTMFLQISKGMQLEILENLKIEVILKLTNNGSFLERGKLKMFGEPQSGICLANLKGGNWWPQSPPIF